MLAFCLKLLLKKKLKSKTPEYWVTCFVEFGELGGPCFRKTCSLGPVARDFLEEVDMGEFWWPTNSCQNVRAS